MRQQRRILIIVLCFLSIAVIFLGNGIVEKRIVNQKINEFKSRGTLVATVDTTSYYIVKKVHDYEDNSRHIMNDLNDKKPGAKADIFVTSRNPIAASKFVGFVSRLTWIGHSALVIDDQGQETIEITGNESGDDNTVRIWDNTWAIEESPYNLTPQIALLRIKNTTPEQRNKVVEYAHSKIGYHYNYTFLFNRANSFYCSDLVSRATRHAGINVNYDHLVATGSDMLTSDLTYIIYLKETTEINGVRHYKIYYLEGMED